jgi:hypothetical protein
MLTKQKFEKDENIKSKIYLKNYLKNQDPIFKSVYQNCLKLMAVVFE